MTAAPAIIARAHPGPQSALLSCPILDVFYGGARGGGKTWGLLLDFVAHAARYQHTARGVLFRRSYPELEEVELQAALLLTPLGWTYRVQTRTWTAPNGALLTLRYLDRDRDAAKYQGRQFTWMAFDEAQNWPTPDAIDRLWATLRSPFGTPVFRRLTGNPGGPGHNWLKARYIDPAPPMTPHTLRVNVDGRRFEIPAVFIPAKLEDNPTLMQHDPGYSDRLAAAGPAWLYRAWRYGLWDIVAGGFFDDLWDRNDHVLHPFAFPKTWRIDRAFDWGSAKPFSVGWWAEADGSDFPGQPRHFPAGSLIRIAEWYGMAPGQPNVGVRLGAADIARGIVEREQTWGLAGRVQRGVTDPSIFSKDDDPSIPSIAAVMTRASGGRVQWLPGDNRPGSRKLRWARVRDMLKAAKQRPAEEAGLWVWETCTHFLRTVPVLQRHETKVDDIDTTQEDHVADELGYRVMHLKGRWTTSKV